MCLVSTHFIQDKLQGLVKSLWNLNRTAVRHTPVVVDDKLYHTLCTQQCYCYSLLLLPVIVACTLYGVRTVHSAYSPSVDMQFVFITYSIEFAVLR